MRNTNEEWLYQESMFSEDPIWKFGLKALLVSLFFVALVVALELRVALTRDRI